MTKKHFKAIAEIFAQHETGQLPPDIQQQASYEEKAGMIYMRRELALAIANFCQSENPRFDRDRFLDACKVVR